MLEDYNETREERARRRNPAIVEAYKAGLTMPEIAQHFGLSASMVSLVCRAAGVSRNRGRLKLGIDCPVQRKKYDRLREMVGPEDARKAFGI